MGCGSSRASAPVAPLKEQITNGEHGKSLSGINAESETKSVQACNLALVNNGNEQNAKIPVESHDHVNALSNDSSLARTGVLSTEVPKELPAVSNEELNDTDSLPSSAVVENNTLLSAESKSIEPSCANESQSDIVLPSSSAAMAVSPANAPKSESFWLGQKIPVLKKSFRPMWILAKPDSSDVFVLQAAYLDRYGDFSPSLSVKSRFLTYKYGAGALLEGEVLHKRASSKLDEPARVDAQRTTAEGADTEKLIQRAPGHTPQDPKAVNDFTVRLMDTIRHHYAVHHLKFERAVRKAQEEYSLCIFLSSPFDGCEKERKYFMESTVLELSALCERKGVVLNVVDMRWGITDELSSSNKTIRTCLQALDDSDIFIGYFGARYGSSNLIYDSRPTWIDKSLEECTQSVYPFLEKYSDVSITEMEWLHAFTHDGNYADPNKPVSFFLFRDRAYDKDMEEKFIAEQNERLAKAFRVENEKSLQAFETLRQTVKEICSLKVPDVDKSYRYGAFFDNYSNPLVGAKIMEACCQILIKEILLKVNPPVKGQELRQAHTAFAKSRLVMFIGDEKVVKEAEEYLQSGGMIDDIPEKTSKLVLKGVKRLDVKNKHLVARQYARPLVLSGQSGGGKSSVMAHLALRAKPRDSHVIYHFVGCNAGSTFLKGMLERLYSEFSWFVLERIRDFTLEPFDQLDLNLVLYRICSAYEELRHKLPRLIIVLDAINQLVDEPYSDVNDLPSELKWLPPEFPPGMKVVISCLDKCSVYGGEMLRVLISRACPVLRLGSLDLDARKDIVYRWHSFYHKAVDEAIMRPLWEHEACANPMFLSLALKELILHGSYATLKQYCDTLLSASSVPALLQNIIKDVANATFIGGIPRPDIVQYALQLVYCSREGLTGIEIIELIRLEQQRQEVTGEQKPRQFLDQTSWIPLIYSLQQLLVARKGLFNFTHDYVRQAVEALYFCGGSSFEDLKTYGPLEDYQGAKMRKIHVHRWLATFFQIRADVDDITLTFQDEYPRSMRELTYHQRMADIRPSVIVAARVRPFSDRERELKQSESICRMKGKQVMIIDPKTKKPTVFNLDFAFDSSDPHSSQFAAQDRVYNLCGADVISQTLEGYNVSIFAYGQTGSGKSYTMFGPQDNPGIIPRTMQELLKQLDLKQKQTGWTWEAKCTMVEIYLNEIRDLLSGGSPVRVICQKAKVPSGSDAESTTEPVEGISTYKELEILCQEERQKLKDKDAEKIGLDSKTKEKSQFSKTDIVAVSLNGAEERSVLSFTDIEKVIQEGEARRATEATLMNDTSSRSHCIFTLVVTQRLEASGQCLVSKVNLVDLAGSERGAKSGHLNKKLVKEAIAINTSLSVLNQCIRALTDPTVRHVPYRQSKLTWMLQDSLGGNAKTVLLATLSPASNNFQESISTLQYAAMAKRMPNSLSKDKDAATLLGEAESMRQEEMDAKSRLCKLYGFSESHLELLREFYTSKSEATFQWMDPSSTTWKKDLDMWDSVVEDNYARQASGQLIQWTKGFQASCTDASQQRYLKAKPGEPVEMEIVYSHKETVSTCIIQYQIAIDFFHPVANISQICRRAELDQTKTFTLTAPSEPGLYMIWSRCCFHYSFAQAEQEYPTNYDRCEDWYRSFIAWIRVDPDATPCEPGKMVWLRRDGEGEFGLEEGEEGEEGEEDGW